MKRDDDFFNSGDPPPPIIPPPPPRNPDLFESERGWEIDTDYIQGIVEDAFLGYLLGEVVIPPAFLDPFAIAGFIGGGIYGAVIRPSLEHRIEMDEYLQSRVDLVYTLINNLRVKTGGLSDELLQDIDMPGLSIVDEALVVQAWFEEGMPSLRRELIQTFTKGDSAS